MKKNTGASTQGKTHLVERCWVLTGVQDDEADWRFRRRCRSTGDLVSVEAAWEWALSQEEQFGDVIGFFHTHPKGAGAQPSSRDTRTMQAWCSALGKTLLCVITDGIALEGYLFLHAGGQPVPVESISSSGGGWYTVHVKYAIGRHNG